MPILCATCVSSWVATHLKWHDVTTRPSRYLVRFQTEKKLLWRAKYYIYILHICTMYRDKAWWSNPVKMVSLRSLAHSFPLIQLMFNMYTRIGMYLLLLLYWCWSSSVCQILCPIWNIYLIYLIYIYIYIWFKAFIIFIIMIIIYVRILLSYIGICACLIFWFALHISMTTYILLFLYRNFHPALNMCTHAWTIAMYYI